MIAGSFLNLTHLQVNWTQYSLWISPRIANSVARFSIIRTVREKNLGEQALVRQFGTFNSTIGKTNFHESRFLCYHNNQRAPECEKDTSVKQCSSVMIFFSRNNKNIINLRSYNPSTPSTLPQCIECS